MTGLALGRRIPPVHSPLTATALFGSLTDPVIGRDLREALASRLAQDYEADRVVLTDSGTEALQLALTFGPPGDRPTGPVAIPAYACYDVATAAVGAGRPIALYDVDPATLTPDRDSLRRCLAEGCRTLVVVHLYGVPVDLHPVLVDAHAAGAVVVEDAAQGHGARWSGRRLGSRGALGVLSFGRGKGWTGGSGGALLIRDGEWAADGPGGSTGAWSELAGALKAGGQWLFARPALFALASAIPFLHLGETRYHPPHSPAAMRRTAAGLLLRTLAGAEQEAANRVANGEWFRRALPTRRSVTQVEIARGARPGWLRLPVLVQHGISGFRDQAGVRRQGIAPGYPRPLAEVPAVRGALVPWCRDARWKGAERLAAQLVTLPTHGGLGPLDRAMLVRALESYGETASRPVYSAS